MIEFKGQDRDEAGLDAMASRPLLRRTARLAACRNFEVLIRGMVVGREFGNVERLVLTFSIARATLERDAERLVLAWFA